MNFPKVIQLLQAEFAKQNIDFALLGGLAIHALGSSRMTSDIDVLALLSDAKQIDAVMQKLGYEILHRTDNVGNYLSKDWDMGRVDVLFAQRKYTTQMLKRAKSMDLLGSKIKTLVPEDIIGLKVQSSSNDPKRAHRDMADVEELMKRHAKEMNWELVREYFELFDRVKEFEELKARYSCT
jgi:predicted nucleotidyltransferase